MKILGLISSYHDPASRFRILQYANYLQQLGAELQIKTFFPPKESDPPKTLNIFSEKLNLKTWKLFQYYSRKKYFSQKRTWDLVWQNRLLLYNSAAIEKKIKKPRIFDFDDAIWLTEGKKEVDAAIATADLVFAGNEFLAEYAIKLNESIEIVPTTVDTLRYHTTENTQMPFTLGWIGTKSNFQYLELIQQPVLEFLRKEKDSRFLIVSSEPPQNISFDNRKMVFKKWSVEKENELINEFSVGLMPLSDNEWCKGKCSAKMLQYMACKKPVIVSPVGTNKKMLAEKAIGLSASSDKEWLEAFQKLKYEPEAAAEMGKNGRGLVERNYSASVWSKKIFHHFQHFAL